MNSLLFPEAGTQGCDCEDTEQGFEANIKMNNCIKCLLLLKAKTGPINKIMLDEWDYSSIQNLLYFSKITWLDSRYRNKQTRTFNLLPKNYSTKKGYACDFPKKPKKILKKSTIFGNFGKNSQDLKIFSKRACDCVRLLNAINC